MVSMKIVPKVRSVGAAFVSPALQRGEKGMRQCAAESRRDGAGCLVCEFPSLLNAQHF
jgi:hypothetical protein